MALYLFNFSAAQAIEARTQRQRAAELLRTGTWSIDPDTPHRGALAAGDLVLIYVSAPDRFFIARAQLASPVQALPPLEASTDQADHRTGVLLSHIEEWDPPVPMEAVLARLDASARAKADFDVDVVRIIPHEYETAVAVAAELHRRD